MQMRSLSTPQPMSTGLRPRPPDVRNKQGDADAQAALHSNAGAAANAATSADADGPPTTPRADARADLAACRTALRHGSKTFLAASLLLPRSVHEPAAALYAFCRLADDAVDDNDARAAVIDDNYARAAVIDDNDARAGVGDDEACAGVVERLRSRVRLAYAGTPQDAPADRALARVVAQFAIPATLFDALLEGFEWDLQGRCYETLDDLHDYAARVAGTVGAMMALLMGVRTPEGLARACDLGVAMQLSNIARDVGEDARMGRLYLPRTWMREAGLPPDAWLASPVHSAALGSVVQRLLDAADALYRRVGAGVAGLPLACRPGINAARFMYAEIGHEVARRGLDSVSARVRVSGARKGWLLLRAVSQLRPVVPRRAEPPLAANAFLVTAATATHLAAATSRHRRRRSVADRIVWTAELFARIEAAGDRLPMARSGQAVA